MSGRMQNEQYVSFDDVFFKDPSIGVRASASVQERCAADYLSFWCPVQRQNYLSKSLLRMEVAAISIPQEDQKKIIHQCIACTQLLEAFQFKGLEGWFADDSASATIVLVIDSSLCNAVEGYHLQVDEKRSKVEIAAADGRGMMYALQTFKQLVRTYSIEGTAEHTSRHATRSIGSYEDIGTEQPVVSLPAIAISDQPAVAERAVMWSMQTQLGSLPAELDEENLRAILCEHVAVLAKSRINKLFFILDFDTEDCLAEDVLAEERRLSNIEQVVLPLFMDICRYYFITVHPVLQIRSIKQMIKATMLKAFETESILLLFLMEYKTVAADLVFNSRRTSTGGVITPAGISVTQVISSSTASAACAKHCCKVVADINAQGLTDITICCSDWVKQTTNFLELCVADGFCVKEQELSQFYPSILFTKPIVCVQDFFMCLKKYLTYVGHLSRRDIAVLPFCDTTDAMRPILLNKMYMILYGGTLWNAHQNVNSWGTQQEIAAIRKEGNKFVELLEELLFPSLTAHQAVMESNSTVPSSPPPPPPPISHTSVTNIPTGYKVAMVSIMIGEMAVTVSNRVGAEMSCNVQTTYSSGDSGVTSTAHSDLHYDFNNSDRSLTLADLAKSEKMLWQLFIAYDDLSFNAVPHKNEVALCLQLYRYILSTAQWKPSLRKNQGMNSFESGRGDCDELFKVLNALSTLSRAIFISSAGVVESHKLSSSVSLVSTGLSRASSIMRESMLMKAHLNEGQKDVGESNLMVGAQIQKRAAVYDTVDISEPYIPKQKVRMYAHIEELLTRVVQQNLLFRNYTAEQHSLIVSGFEPITVESGEVVIKQGDPGDYFYIIESGRADIFMESSGFKIKIGRTLSAGDYFGELALMYNTPRAATVVSTEPCKLWCIDRQTYRRIVTQHSRSTAMEFVSLISNVHIMGKRIGDVFSPVELNKVVSSLEVEEFQHGQVIVRQHLTGDYFYIITEGFVDVWQQQDGTGSGSRTPKRSSTTSEGSDTTTADNAATASIVSGEPAFSEDISLLGVRVATLTRGDYFGEKALLEDDVRQASCVAKGKVVCLSLSRADFIAIFGSWNELTEQAERRKTRVAVPEKESFELAVSVNELDVLGVLGVGAFGKVSLVQHVETGEKYALKAQSKSHICAQGMQEMLTSEMRTMRKLQNQFIVRLFSAMQDSKYVYFLLELLPGGEFFNYLGKVGKLTEDQARFYSASVVLAFEAMHNKQIAYRDLKPENMVLDARGFVKLVDLGLAKEVSAGSTWTMCGTPDYLAPEIVLNKGHDYSVDYWALGVLIYEMIHGWPPFYHDDQMKVYAKIVKGKVNYPDDFSSTLEDFISKLLTKNPSKRLGNMKNGIIDIIRHKWYGPFDWIGMRKGRITPPYTPPPADHKFLQQEDMDSPDANAVESDWVLDLLQ